MIRLVALIVSLASAAWADDALRLADRARLTDLSMHFGNAVQQAFAAGSQDDLDALRAAMTGPDVGGDLSGDWSCRTIKVGGITPVTAYPEFRCRIARTGPETWMLEKLTGSQRTRGVIRKVGLDLTYLGVGYVGNAPAVDYADLPDSQTPVDPGQTVAVVGRVQIMSDRRARVLMPAPILESTFDILYLTR